MRRIAFYGTVLALIHLAIVLLHGRAHAELHIDLSSLQTIFVVGVIVIGPRLAMLLLWTRYQRAGLWLLTLSMTGACLFGLYNHFVALSPDHVTQVPHGSWGEVFRTTAVLLVIVDGVSAIAGLYWLRVQPEPFHTRRLAPTR